LNDQALLEEIIELATRLVRIPSVTVGGRVRFDALYEARDVVKSYLAAAGLEIYPFEEGEYPALIAAFPGLKKAPVMMSGHFDVVAPEPDDSQFLPVIEGDYFCGRGCADMKTMVATLMVWMKDQMTVGPPFPPLNLMLIGNEETGERDAMGTSHVLKKITDDPGWDSYEPDLFIAAERTGEEGHEIWGEIQPENRGAARLQLIAEGQRMHSALAGGPSDIVNRLSQARQHILDLADGYLTLESEDEWKTLLRFPYLLVGEEGVYNITAERGTLGVEIRPIPQDDVVAFVTKIKEYAISNSLVVEDLLIHPGIACDPDNSYLLALMEAVRRASSEEPVIGRKMAGTSARFAPNGQGVVWGQTGIDPHSKNEKHFIPSIIPYYKALDEFGKTSAEVALAG
jgi:acetylornithine deacetylase/succinyl-diaminopimelate desuccinylase-like protein